MKIQIVQIKKGVIEVNSTKYITQDLLNNIGWKVMGFERKITNSKYSFTIEVGKAFAFNKVEKSILKTMNNYANW